MGAFRNPKFVGEFAYRTKWNYYQLRYLQETDQDKIANIQKSMDQISYEMKSRDYIMEDFYEVTQLLNSMIGLLVFPEQAEYNAISNVPEELPTLFPVLYKCLQNDNDYYNNYVILSGDSKGSPELVSAQNIIRHLRNAASHYELAIIPESGVLENGNEVIRRIVFKDHMHTAKYGDLSFALHINVEDLEGLLMEICDILINGTR